MSPRHNQASSRASSYELTVSLNSKANLVDLINQYGVILKKNGRTYTALCPFHPEKTPSFSVNPRTNRYHCFGCGASGYASHFLKNHLKMSKMEAIQHLAELTHTPLENIEQLRYEIAQADKTKEILKLSAEFYANIFRTDGGAMLEYVIENRGFAFQTCIDQFIGASSTQNSLVSYFNHYHQKFTDDDLIAAGVAKRHDKRITDYFGGERVIFPVFDSARRVVMLTGRDITGKSKAKYLHTPHPKSQVLYGVHALRRYTKLIVAEGHFDVLRGIEYGLPIVGTMGGMGSEWQIRRLLELSGYGDKPIYLCADTDTTGINAAFKSVKLFFGEIAADGGLVKVAQLPAKDTGEKHDPDSFLLAHGNEEFHGVLDAALPGSEFFKSQFYQSYNFEDFALQSPEMQATLRSKLTDELKNVPECQFKTDLCNLALSGKNSAGIPLNQPAEFLIADSDEEECFPIDALGSLGMRAALSLMKIVQCSPNMAAHQVLAAMMTATCSLGKIESYNPSSKNDFISLNFAFLTIAEPGEGKGRSEKALLNGLFHLSRQYGKQYKKDCERFEQVMADWKRINGSDHKKQGYKKPTDDEGNPLSPLEKVIDPPLRPQCKSFVKQSPNVSVIQRLFFNGSPFVAILLEEGNRWFSGWGMREGRGDETLATIIQLIDQGTITHNTASSDEDYEKRAVALSLGIQPGMWDRLVADGVAEQMGFLSRFAMLRPISTQGSRHLAQPDQDDQFILEQFNHRTVDLMELALNHACAPRDDFNVTPKISMGELINQVEIRCIPQAWQLWRDFWQELEWEKAVNHPTENRPGMFKDLRNYVNKYDQLVGKIAGWLALFECDLDKLATQEEIPVVNVDIMLRAIRIVRFYMNEIYRVANRPKVDQNTEQANKLLNWMYNPVVKQRNGKFTDFQVAPVVTEDGYRIFTMRDLMRYGPGRESKARIIELLEIIVKHDGIGRIVTGGAKGSIVFELAPKQKELYN